MVVTVHESDDGWVARRGDHTAGEARALVRPDGRCLARFVRCAPEAYQPLTEAVAGRQARDVYVSVDDGDRHTHEQLLAAGFVGDRYDVGWRLPTDPAATGLSDAALAQWAVRSAEAVAEEELRLLDDELRQDHPGLYGWRWSADEFREETYSEAFDPAVYLVADDPATFAPAGLVRVWRNPSGPRLGFIGVRRPYRRRGLVSALLARVFATLHREGTAEVTAGADAANLASHRLFTAIGGHRAGGSTLLVRRCAQARPAD